MYLHRVRDELPRLAVLREQRFGMLAVQRRHDNFTDLAARIQLIADLHDREQPLCRAVDAEHDRVTVDEQEALAHAGRQRREFLLPPFQLDDLLLNGEILHLNAADERRQLGIDIRVGIVQIERIDRLRDLLCRAECQHAGDHQHQHRHPEHGAHRRRRRPHRTERTAQPQNAAVFAAQRIIHRALTAALRFAAALALTRCEGIAYLRAVRLIRGLARELIVIEHGTVCGDPCDAVDAAKRFEIALPADPQPVFRIDRLLLQRGIGLVIDLAVLQPEEQHCTEQHHGDADCEHALEDCFRHASSPLIR